jgi:hypothetical protein
MDAQKTYIPQKVSNHKIAGTYCKQLYYKGLNKKSYKVECVFRVHYWGYMRDEHSIS